MILIIKTVSKLKVGENCYTEDQFEILEEEGKFYESFLYLLVSMRAVIGQFSGPYCPVRPAKI